jgi:putative colanic acid biosynthesis acetyltransferase WcaF
MYIRITALKCRGLRQLGFSFIDPKCKISCPKNITIGPGCIIGNCHLYALDKIVIGRNTIIGDGVFVCTGSHDIDSDGFNLVTKSIEIGDYVWISTNATILPGVVISSGAVIGACAVVSKDVPSGGVVVGNPGKIIRTRANFPKRSVLHLVGLDLRQALQQLLFSNSNSPGSAEPRS